MRRFSRASALALAAPAGVLGICMVLPRIDPTCGMGADSVRAVSACGITQAAIWRDAALVGSVIVAIVAAMLLVSIGIQLVLHHRVSDRLRRHARPTVIADHAVGLVPGNHVALVAGIRHPRIYCSADLVTRLAADELRAVLLHERHHALVHAPARLVILSALTPFLGLLGLGSAWLERRRARLEIAADEHAIGHGATRATLAQAILKIGDRPPRPSLAGFATASDLRLRALLGEDIASTAHRPWAAGIAVVATVLVPVFCSVVPIL